MSLQSPVDQYQRVVLDRFRRPFTAEASGTSLNLVPLECVARDIKRRTIGFVLFVGFAVMLVATSVLTLNQRDAGKWRWADLPARCGRWA